MPAKPSAIKLQKIAKRYFDDLMISAEASRLHRLNPGPLYREQQPSDMDPETFEYQSLGDLQHQRDEYDEINEILERNIELNQFHDVHVTAEDLLSKDGIEFKTDDDTSRRLSALLLRAALAVNSIMRSRAYGRYDAVSDDPLFVVKKDIDEPPEIVETNKNTHLIKPKKIGRPGVEIEALRVELYRLKDAGKLPPIQQGWRMAVARAFLKWHNEKFPENKVHDPQTIATRLKEDFDKIEQ